MSNFPINPIDSISLNGYLQNLSVPAIRDLLAEQALIGNFSENLPETSISSSNGKMAPEIPERDGNLPKIAAPEQEEGSGPFMQTFGTSAKNRTAYVNPYMDRYIPETLSSQTQEALLAAQDTPSNTEDLTTSKKTPDTKNSLELLSPETSASESELSLSGKVGPEQTIATLLEFSQRTNEKNIFNPRAVLFNPLTGKRISSQTFSVPYNTLISPLHSSLSPLLDIRSTIIQETTRGELFPVLELDVKHTQQLLSRLLATVAGFSQSGGGQVDCIIDSQALNDTAVRLRFIIQAQQLNLPQSVTAYLNGNEPLPSGPPLENLALNLGLCYQLAAFMKGTLSIRGNSEEGTLFYLELPARKGSSRQGQYSSVIGRFSGRRILLAIQNSPLRDSTEALLHKRDIFVDSAADCDSAVRLFRKGKAGYYDAVLSSLGDPLTQQIRVLNRPDAPRVPIIAILPSPSGERLSNAFQSGCSTCLIQPFTAQELFDTLDLLLL